MSFSILSIILSVIYTLIVIFLTSKLLSYDFIITKLIYLGVALMPAVLMIIIFLQEYWVIIALLATIPVSKIPLPLLDALSFNYVINTGLLCLVIAGITINKRIDKSIFYGFSSKIMLCVFAWSTARLMYDRPGAGSVGGTGGLSSALPVVLAGACYFAIIALTINLNIQKKHIKAMWIGLSICVIEVIYRNLTKFIPLGGFISIFSFPCIWAISMLAITYPLKKAKDNIFKNEIKLSLMSIAIIMSSIISMNRLPMITTTLALGMSYFLYSVTTKYLRILIPALIIIVSLAIFTPEMIPKSAVRTLSLITPQYFQGMQGIGEIGWQSNWRTELAKIAWHEMKQNPIAGKGFAFSQSELYYNAIIAKTGVAGRFGGLLSSGGYHNGILFLGVKLGIPITLLFVIALLTIYIKFIIFSKHMHSGVKKQFSVMLASTFLCILGKMLTNGGPLDIFNITIYLGIMQGLMLQTPDDQEKPDNTITKKETLADSIMLKRIEYKNKTKTYRL